MPAAPRPDSVALRWLDRQLAWESTLAELRDTDGVTVLDLDDEVAA